MDSQKIITDIDQQLIKQLFDNAWATIIAGQIVAVLIFMGLKSHVSSTNLLIWGVIFTTITAIRLTLVGYWKHHTGNLQNRVKTYAMGALFAGICWADLIFFLTQPMPVYQQLFIMITLVGMPMAAMPSNSIYIHVYAAFATPIMIALVYWSLFIIDDLNIYFFGIAAVYSLILFKTALIYQNNLRQSLTMGFENKSLVDKLSEVNKKLEKIAYYDPLTCLANRRWFQTRAEEALSRCVRNKARLALLLIDVDNFKQVNDQQGHAAGDNLLISIADRLTSSLRQTDTVIRGGIEAARYGGDEFVVLLEDISDKESAELVVKRIFSKLNVPIDLFGKPWPVTVSIGIAIAPDDANNLTTLTRSADTAMYRVKENGRNGYCFFNINDQTVV